jgi:antitoxin (DNA-binding transcriptional repressor) of toxin-antitoxin stability system
MKTIEISAASKSLAEYAEELNGDIVILTSENKPVAALVPLKDVDCESWSLGTNEVFLDLIEQARTEFREGKTISLEEMKRVFLPLE